MARTTIEIQNGMLTDIASNEVLSVQLTSTSKVAIYRLFTYIVASAVYLLEKLFDNHKKEIDTAIYEQKSGTPRWYRNMSLEFQYGFDLLEDSDKFDNAGFTTDQIEASKIIK